MIIDGLLTYSYLGLLYEWGIARKESKWYICLMQIIGVFVLIFK